MGRKGFFLVHREVFDHWVWKRGGKEWIWLLGHAAHSDTVIKFSGHPVRVKRGQYATCYRHLARYWKMSLSWVCEFLHELRDNGTLRLEPIVLPGKRGTKRRKQDGTLITIVNYEKYQSLRDLDWDGQNDVENKGGDIEQAISKKEAAAMVASDRTAAPPSQDHVQHLLSLLAGVEGPRREPTAAETSRLTGVADGAGWPAVEAKILEVARREKKKGKPPRSFNYYLTVLSDLDASACKLDPKEIARQQSLEREQGKGELDPSKSAANQPYDPPQEEEPERGPAYEESKKVIAKLFGPTGLPGEGAADTKS